MLAARKAHQCCVHRPLVPRTKGAYSHHVRNGNKRRLLTSRQEREQRALTHITSGTRSTRPRGAALYTTSYSDTSLFFTPVPLLRHFTVLYTSPATQTLHCSLHQSRYSNTSLFFTPVPLPATQTLHCSLHQSRYSNTALFFTPVPLLKHSTVLYTSPATQTLTDASQSELKIKSTDNFKTKFHFFWGLVFVNGGKLTSK